MGSRKVPTANIDVMGGPDAIPERKVGEFIESCKNEDNFIKAPALDKIGEGLEEVYIESRLEHLAMIRERAALTENHQKQAETNKHRIQELRNAQSKLKGKFIQINIFLRDFGEKSNNAVKKVKDELAIHENIRSQCVDMQALNEEFDAFRTQLKATADEYAPYEQVLNDVVDKLHAFNSVEQCMDSCDALMMAQVEILELGENITNEMEAMRKRLVEISREAAFQVLGLKNALSSIDNLFEKANNRVLIWERTLGNAKTAIHHSRINKDRSLEGIDCIYRLLCKRRHIQVLLPYEDVAKRLSFIKGEVELLHEMQEFYNKKYSKKTRHKKDWLC